MDALSSSTLRERLLQRLLLITATVAAVAYVPGVIASWQQGLGALIALNTLAWLAVLALTLWRRGPYGLRGALFLGLWFAFAVALTWLVGPLGAGPAWMVTVPAMAALLFGMRGAWLALIGILTMGVVYTLWLVAAGGATEALPGPAYDVYSWTASLGAVLFLSAVLATGTASLMNGLERSASELRAANEQLEEALRERERLESELVRGANVRALGTLASRIAHDLNNLLLPVLMASGEARDASPPGTAERKRLELVVTSAERARDLALQVLAFGREVAPERRPLALHAAVEEVAALLGPALPSSAALQVSLPEREAKVWANPAELHQVLMNLGSNAARALRRRGSLLQMAVSLHDTTEEVEVVVRDDGPGIARDDLKRVFDPYFTTHGSDQGSDRGTGLGMPIVRHVVESLGGRIHIETALGVGTSVSVWLPWFSVPTASDGTAAEPAGTETSLRVLLVDDDDMVRASTRMVLESLGHEVIEASSADAALASVRDAPQAVDLVLSDQAMPGMRGIELAAMLLELRGDLPVVLMSGFVDDATQQRASEVGVRLVLSKPFDRRRLTEAIAAATA